ALDATPATTDFFGSKRTPSNDLGAHEQSTTLGSSAPATPGTTPARELTGRANGTTIELTWTASTTDGASYKVYRDNAFVADVTGTRFTDNGRSAATTYNYEVVAVSAIGNAGPGAYITVTTAPAGDSQKPTMVTSLRASATTNSTITLNWNAASDNVAVKAYEIYSNGKLMASVTNNRAKITGLAAGTSYSFSVVAVDAAGNKSVAAAVTASTTGTAARRRSVGRR
ncbi:MAG TPA: fibronectin type III domain-containing protein, partial [Thermoanaerobaculia bacterium]|nr:fibronectin type III domain-containing protein [Thermoanaerobaculia bacterium]